LSEKRRSTTGDRRAFNVLSARESPSRRNSKSCASSDTAAAAVSPVLAVLTDKLIAEVVKVELAAAITVLCHADLG